MVDLTGAHSVNEIFVRHARHRGHERAFAIVADPADPTCAQWFTYTELDRAARVCARELSRIYPPGTRVLLLQPTSAEFIVAVLGCLYAGLVAVPSSLPGRYQQDQRRVLSIARDAEVGCVLTTESEQADVLGWAEAQGIAAPVFIPQAEPAGAAEDFEPYEAGPDTLALLQYTSGSTSAPKGNRVTHRNLLANAASTAEAFPVGPGQRFGGWLPNYHDMGLMGHILSPLLAGFGTVLMSPTAFLRRPRAWLELIDAYDIAVSAAPNFAYELCLTRVNDQQVEGLDLSRWSHAVSGSEPIKASVLDEFAARFAPAGFHADQFAPCFGMAEATLLVSMASRRRPRVLHCDTAALAKNRVLPVAYGTGSTLVSCGTPRDLDVRVVDPDTLRELPEGRVGEVWLSGPSVVDGYWGDTEATLATFGHRLGDRDGFLRTGDLGVLVDGELYITGRIKEMMIFRGRNVYPHDIEHELRRQHEELRDTVGSVISVPAGEDGDGQLVVIHEVRRRADEEQLARLGARIRATVAREFGIRAHSVLLMRRGNVRRTTSGKVQRSAMRALYLDGELTPLWGDGYEPAASGAGAPL